MFDPNDEDEGSKLSALRGDFQAALDARREALEEAHRAGRTYHNTNNEGQWEQSDLTYLREQNRPVLSFNLVASKINTFVGTVLERKRKPSARGIGGEDTLVADVLNAVADRAAELTNAAAIEADTLKQGCVHGEHHARFAVDKDPSNPLGRRYTLDSLPCYEVSYDPASRLADRSDARFVFWDRWLSKTEFNATYPDASWEEVSARGDSEIDAHEYEGSDKGELHELDDPTADDMYSSGAFDRYYWNPRHQQVRVIHSEYKVPKKRYWIIDLQAGVAEETTRETVESFEDYQAMGFLQGMTPETTTDEEVYAVQWVAGQILFDGPLDQPFDGFSIETFSYAVDSELNTAYGAVRNLFDPQTETNKAHSLALELQAGQHKTGTIAEKGALDDPAKFEEQTQRSGSVAIVRDGALVENRVRERPVPQFSPATAQRLSDSVTMFDKISNVITDDATPAGQAEAFGTVQLRHRKSQIAMADVIQNYDRFLKNLKERYLQAIVRDMPEPQIIEYLGNSPRYQIQDRMIYEVDPATGQPEKQAQLEELKTLRFDLTLEVTSENISERMMETQGLAQLKQIGVAVDDEVIVELATANRSTRERLKTYAAQSNKAAQESAQAQAQQAQAQMQQMVALEQGRSAETARHNQAEEQLKLLKIQGDMGTDLAAIYERADDAERSAVLEVFRAVQQRQQRA